MLFVVPNDISGGGPAPIGTTDPFEPIVIDLFSCWIILNPELLSNNNVLMWPYVNGNGFISTPTFNPELIIIPDTSLGSIWNVFSSKYILLKPLYDVEGVDPVVLKVIDVAGVPGVPGLPGGPGGPTFPCPSIQHVLFCDLFLNKDTLLYFEFIVYYIISKEFILSI